MPHTITVQGLQYHFASHLGNEQCFGCVDAYATPPPSFFGKNRAFKLVRQLVILKTSEIQATPF